MTRTDDDVARAAAYLEMTMAPYLRSGGPREDLALAMMAAASALLVPRWGAARVLGAMDKLVENAAEAMQAGRS